MKRLSRMNLMILLISTGIFFSLSGCKKDKNDDPVDPNVWTFGTLSANVGGTNWSAKSVYAADSSGLMVIVAANDNTGNGYPMVLIAFPNTTAEGATLAFDISQTSMLQYLENSSAAFWAEPAFGGSGSVKITKYNKTSKRIEGTFSGTAVPTQGTGSKTISNGQFAINYK